MSRIAMSTGSGIWIVPVDRVQKSLRDGRARVIDSWIARMRLAPSPAEDRRDRGISAHDAFSYYGKRYGLTLGAAAGAFNGE